MLFDDCRLSYDTNRDMSPVALLTQAPTFFIVQHGGDFCLHMQGKTAD